MSTTISMEELLKGKVSKLNELKMATLLFRHRGALKEQLSRANVEMNLVKGDVEVTRRNLEKMKELNTFCNELLTSLRELDTRIVYMEKNLPEEFLQEFTRLTEETSQIIENPCKTQNPMRDDDNAEIQIIRRLSNANMDSPRLDIEDCKKTLFKNAEDSYSMDLLSEEEFSQIPKYMIGRQSLCSLNEFVTTINAILKAKYDLLTLGKNGARKKGKLDVYLSLKRNEIDVGPGEDPIYFFTAEDYFRHTRCKLDKTKLNLLTVLRHCKRLRELRIGKNLHYVLVAI